MWTFSSRTHAVNFYASCLSVAGVGIFFPLSSAGLGRSRLMLGINCLKGLIKNKLIIFMDSTFKQWPSTVIASLDNHSNVKISEEENLEEFWQMIEQNGNNVDI